MKNKFNIGDIVAAEGITFMIDNIALKNERLVYSSRNIMGYYDEKDLKLYQETEIYYQYIYKLSDGYVWHAAVLCKDDEDFKKKYTNTSWFQKLPTPFEVPV